MKIYNGSITTHFDVVLSLKDDNICINLYSEEGFLFDNIVIPKNDIEELLAQPKKASNHKQIVCPRCGEKAEFKTYCDHPDAWAKRCCACGFIGAIKSTNRAATIAFCNGETDEQETNYSC